MIEISAIEPAADIQSSVQDIKGVCERLGRIFVHTERVLIKTILRRKDRHGTLTDTVPVRGVLSMVFVRKERCIFWLVEEML